MIAEGLKALAGMIEESIKPHKVEVADPRLARFAINGALTEIPIPPPPRDHEPKSLEDVIELANRFAQGKTLPVVWYDEEEVTLVIDDSEHRFEVATLSLNYSDVFRRIAALRANREWHNLKPFVRLIRIDLAGALDPSALLNHVKNLRFDNGVATTAEVSRNRESLGREITSKVDSATLIPEEVVLSTPVYKTLGEKERFGLRCAVEVDPAEGKLQLLPLPDEIERIQHLAVASIAGRLKSLLNETVPCYFGKP